MLLRYYTLSPHTRLAEVAGRRWLLCRHPLQQFELNESAWRVLSALRPGTALEELVSPLTPELLDFLELKTAQGALRADYAATAPRTWPEVEVVIPVYANPAGLLRCLRALAAQAYPKERLRVTVVDDGSPQPVRDALPDAPPMALTLRWLRLEQNQGPATARNAALRQPWFDAPEGWGTLCAFIDSDCVPAPAWLAALVSVLEDQTLAATGGQVLGLRRDTWLARYEAECSSLNLGAQAGAAGDLALRHPYLPTCNLLVRRCALEGLGGFRDGLRFGEDVDLCWRLRAAGGRLFYYPPGAVAHDHRVRVGPFLARRCAYARSESWLRRAHPAHFPRGGLGALRAVVVVSAAASLAEPLPGLMVLGLGLVGEAALFWLRHSHLPVPLPVIPTAAALARRSAGGLAQVCRGAARVTLALWLPAAALFPSLWPALVAMLALGAWAEWQARRPALRLLEFAAGFGLDALGYSAGRLAGMLPLRKAAEPDYMPEGTRGE
jgi:mycofactocin system glycosyltransferase